MYNSFQSFTEKSAEIMLQRKTWSSQKGRPLMKVHIYSSTRGFAMNMSGFWPATANDAAIILSELKKRKVWTISLSSKNFLANYLLDYLQKFKHDTDGQVVLLADRGYRFIANEVESYE